jgi:hypothetical protein
MRILAMLLAGLLLRILAALLLARLLRVLTAVLVLAPRILIQAADRDHGPDSADSDYP